MKKLDWRETTENNFDFNTQNFDEWKKTFGDVFTPRLCFELANFFFAPPESLVLDFESKTDLTAALDALLTDYEVKTAPVQIKLHITRWFAKQSSTPQEISTKQEVKPKVETMKQPEKKIAVNQPEKKNTVAMKQPDQKKSIPVKQPEKKIAPVNQPEKKNPVAMKQPDQKKSNPVKQPEQKKSNPVNQPEQKKSNPVKQPEQKKSNPVKQPEKSKVEKKNQQKETPVEQPESLKCSNCRFLNSLKSVVCSICQCPLPKISNQEIQKKNPIQTKPVPKETQKKTESLPNKKVETSNKIENVKRPREEEQVKKIENPSSNWTCTNCHYSNLSNSVVCLICQHSIPKKSKPSLEDSKEIETKKEISKKTIQDSKEIKKENTKKINQNDLKENSSFEKNTIPKVIQEPKEIKKETSKKINHDSKEIKKENTKKINQNDLKENSSFEKNTTPKEPAVDESISLEDWNCTNCRKRNKAQRKVCFLCLSPK
jgi:hypothetical protein